MAMATVLRSLAVCGCVRRQMESVWHELHFWVALGPRDWGWHCASRSQVNRCSSARESCRAYDIRNPATVSWRAPAAHASHALGRTSDARRLALEDLELAQAWGAPRTLGRAQRIAGLVHHCVQNVVQCLLAARRVVGVSRQPALFHLRQQALSRPLLRQSSHSHGVHVGCSGGPAQPSPTAPVELQQTVTR